VIPAQFEYARPASVDEVLTLLRDKEGEAKVLSGGYSLLPLMKLRLAQPGLLVDLRDVSGLDGIRETDDDLRIGARATHRQVHEHPIIADRYPFLAEVAGGIGDPQVRNWGTIGGSVAHADPASDWPAAMLADGTRIVCRGLGGERVVPAREFFLGPFSTAIEPTELLVEVRFTRRSRGVGGAYTKLERRTGDFATVGAAAVLALADGRISSAGIAITGVNDTPFAATAAEAALAGKAPSDEAFRAAGEAAAGMAHPVSDVRGSAAYKRAMVAEMTVRSLRRAADRALRSA
jgi:aerobic carbon-monoxide dehydrogenase medium subunit